jgi:hypothetical protein
MAGVSVGRDLASGRARSANAAVAVAFGKTTGTSKVLQHERGSGRPTSAALLHGSLGRKASARAEERAMSARSGGSGYYSTAGSSDFQQVHARQTGPGSTGFSRSRPISAKPISVKDGRARSRPTTARTLGAAAAAAASAYTYPRDDRDYADVSAAVDAHLGETLTFEEREAELRAWREKQERASYFGPKYKGGPVLGGTGGRRRDEDANPIAGRPDSGVREVGWGWTEPDDPNPTAEARAAAEAAKRALPAPSLNANIGAKRGHFAHDARRRPSGYAKARPMHARLSARYSFLAGFDPDAHARLDACLPFNSFQLTPLNAAARPSARARRALAPRGAARHRGERTRDRLRAARRGPAGGAHARARGEASAEAGAPAVAEGAGGGERAAAVRDR